MFEQRPYFVIGNLVSNAAAGSGQWMTAGRGEFIHWEMP